MGVPRRPALLQAAGLSAVAAVVTALTMGGAGKAKSLSYNALARSLLEMSGVKGGLIVHLGCGEGRLTASLLQTNRFLVHGLDRNPENVKKAREFIRSLGLYGKVSVDRWDGLSLPYVEGSVNLIVAEEWSPKIAREALRVLAPKGVALVKEGRSWRKVVKPWPKEIDEWTHALHDPTNNAVSHDEVVGPPFHLQWVSGPRWTRSHDHLNSVSVVVSSGGRLFYIEDEGPRASVALPSRWFLVARDAFNGILLWKRRIKRWEGQLRGFRSGPSNISRRLVAVGDKVFVTLGYGEPVSCLDAATGETLKVYEGTENTREIVYSEGVLYLVVAERPQSGEVPEDQRGRPWPEWTFVNPDMGIMAVEAKTGRVLWRKFDEETEEVMPTTLAVAEGRVFFQNTRQIVCLDARSGKVIWRADRSVSTNRPAWSAPTLVVYKGVVLSADRAADSVFLKGERAPEGKVLWVVTSRGGNAPPGELIAFSAKDGRRLWSTRCREGYNSPVDVLVADGLIWTGDLVRASDPGITQALDPFTGEVRKTKPPDQMLFHVGMGHHRCYRNRATDRYLILGRAGVEFVDVKTGKVFPNHWVRGTCQYGVLPANGLLYVPPHSCACYIEAKLNSFVALAPRRKGEAAMLRLRTRGRLERGPAYEWAQRALTRQVEGGADWPTYRHDPERSGHTGAPLPAEGLRQIWRAKVGGKVTAPVAADGMVFVAEVDGFTLHALNAEDGSEVWHFVAGGRIDSPPTAYRGLLLFGCGDGYVYCLRARDGKLVWRFRAAPEDRRLVAYGRLESVWPVHGSVLVVNGAAYFAAGRSSYLDGGIVVYKLDPITGKLLAVRRLYSRDPKTGMEPEEQVRGVQMPGALPDLLSSDGKSVFMRHVRLDLNLEEQEPNVPHLFSPAGFLDDSWWHRTYWLYGTRMWSGYGGWPIAARRGAPAGRIMVLDERRIFGYGRERYDNWAHVGIATGYRLFSTWRPKGAGSMVSVAKSPSLNPAGKPLTVEAWVKPQKGGGVVVARGGRVHGYALYLKQWRPHFSVRVNGKIYTVRADGTIPPGRWAHLAGVLTAEGRLLIFVNGRRAGEAEGKLLVSDPGEDMQIGADEGSNVANYRSPFPFVGEIDEVRIHHRALPAEEMRSHFESPERTPRKEEGLVLCYSFDDGTARDLSGNGNDGTVGDVEPVAGRVGKALRFKGGPTLFWEKKVPLCVRAMVLAGKTLFVAGPPDKDENGLPDSLEGRDGLLLAVSAEDGKILFSRKTDFRPVFDGMAAARGRLYISTEDGSVVCLGTA